MISLSMLLLTTVALMVGGVVWRGIAIGNAIRIADALWLLIFGLGLFFAVYLGEREKLKVAIGAGLFMSAIAAAGLILRGYIIRVQKQIQHHIQAHTQQDITDHSESAWTQQSSFVELSLDPRSGLPFGHIKAGRFQGYSLDTLSLDQVCMQLEDCRKLNDHPSVTLLQAYLDRVYGLQWRSHLQQEEITHPFMRREEAYFVLGLKPEASLQEIKEAHHHLMQRLHPDQGGSAYLATKINQARDVLLHRTS